MHYTIKTLLNQGKSLRSIAATLGVHRKTVKRIAAELARAHGEVITPAPVIRPSKLDPYQEKISAWVTEEGLSPLLVHQRLCDQNNTSFSYSAVRRYLLRHFPNSTEVYVPLVTDPGQEAQVDFGYFGYFEKDGKKVKVWVFCMVLSHSRYAYYREVTDQSIPTFLRCHMEAFEFFGGVPATVKIDNLKAGVLQADFFEPTIQHQYGQMLAHYGAAPITARIRRGQDKGKVEAGIKYVKYNFLKALGHTDYYPMTRDLAHWNSHTCNRRLHGTTRKVPADVFKQEEQSSLLPLPGTRFELTDISHRRVSSLGHIYFGYNYYSVPYTLVGKALRTESNGRLLRVYEEDGSGGSRSPVAVHAIASGQGAFITLEAHKPPQKRTKSIEQYREQLQAAGPGCVAFLDEVISRRPRHWQPMVRGIIHLLRVWDHPKVDGACSRALAYGAISYQSVKRICEQGLEKEEPAQEISFKSPGGYGHELSLYDRMFP